jgi:hypothetical protein
MDLKQVPAFNTAMKLPRRQFLRLAALAVGVPTIFAPGMRASLSGAAGAHFRRFRRWRRARHRRAPDGAMAVGAIRPAVHH